MSPEKPTENYAEQRLAERLQFRREQFYEALENACVEKQYSIKRITGTDAADETAWIEFRFIPLDKDGHSLPDYEFHQFIDTLVPELNSDEHFVTWFEHPTEGQVAKVEIDES